MIYYDHIDDLDRSSTLDKIYNDRNYNADGTSVDEEFGFQVLFADLDDLTGASSSYDVYYAPSLTRQYVDTTVENGGILSCVDDGTCPTAGTTGAFGNALDFDGSDDFLTVPKLATEEVVEPNSDETHIFFWLNIDSYPTSGNAMILDSDSSEDGAIDIYLDSSGYLHFDSYGYDDGVSASPIGTGSWVHIGYRRGEELFIDGVSQGDITSDTNTNYFYPVYGPGRLGNSLSGDAPFDGQIDELAVYHEGGVTSSLISGYIYQGDYFRSSSGLRADAVFQFEELIADDTDSNVGYLNLVSGLRDADCRDSSNRVSGGDNEREIWRCP